MSFDISHLPLETLGACLEQLMVSMTNETCQMTYGKSSLSFLMPIWLGTLRDDSYEQVVKEIGRLINEEKHEAEFALSVKATLVVGRKALNQ